MPTLCVLLLVLGCAFLLLWFVYFCVHKPSRSGLSELDQQKIDLAGQTNILLFVIALFLLVLCLIQLFGIKPLHL